MIKQLILVVEDGEYPNHFSDVREFKKNTQVIRYGLNALKDTSCIQIETLERQLEKEVSERAKDLATFEKRLLDVQRDFQYQEGKLIEQGRLLVRHELDELRYANAILLKEQNESKEREHYLVEKAKQELYKEVQDCVRKCDQLQNVNDTLLNQICSITTERVNNVDLLSQQMIDLKENHHQQMESAKSSIFDLNTRLQNAFNSVQEKWEAGVEYGKRIQSQRDKGELGEDWVSEHVLKWFPGCTLVDVRTKAHHGDYHLTVDGVKILIECKNTATYCSSQYQKFMRDLDTCASGTDPIHAGLYVNLQNTKRERMWHVENMGNLPHALLDNASAHSKLIELAIRTLVYTVHQVRESTTQLSDCDKKLKSLQDSLHILVEGTLTKVVKELISSANTTLTRARTLEDVFIQQILALIDRRPASLSLKRKRTGEYPPKSHTETQGIAGVFSGTIRDSLYKFLSGDNRSVIVINQADLVKRLVRHGLDKGDRSLHTWNDYTRDYVVRNFGTKGIHYSLYDVEGTSQEIYTIQRELVLRHLLSGSC